MRAGTLRCVCESVCVGVCVCLRVCVAAYYIIKRNSNCVDQTQTQLTLSLVKLFPLALSISLYLRFACS